MLSLAKSSKLKLPNHCLLPTGYLLLPYSVLIILLKGIAPTSSMILTPDKTTFFFALLVLFSSVWRGKGKDRGESADLFP